VTALDSLRGFCRQQSFYVTVSRNQASDLETRLFNESEAQVNVVPQVVDA
jgi:hypothetical protein